MVQAYAIRRRYPKDAVWEKRGGGFTRSLEEALIVVDSPRSRRSWPEDKAVFGGEAFYEWVPVSIVIVPEDRR